jgi:hypothetical protein
MSAIGNRGTYMVWRSVIQRLIRWIVIVAITLVLVGTSERSIEAAVPDVSYNGGPVLSQGTAYIIFGHPPVVGKPTSFEDAGSAASDANYEQTITDYFQHVQGTGFADILAQYSVSAGEYVKGGPLGDSSLNFGGVYDDTTHGYPSGVGPNSLKLYDSDIQHEVQSAISANSTNGWTAGPTNAFFVFTGRDVQDCYSSSGSSGCTNSSDGSEWCGYHSGTTGSPTDSTLLYAVVADAGPSGATCPVPTTALTAGDVTSYSAVSTSSHEQFEMATDPYGSTVPLIDVCGVADYP